LEFIGRGGAGRAAGWLHEGVNAANAAATNFALAKDRSRTIDDVGRIYALFTLAGITFGVLDPIVTRSSSR